jgi:hypothetical protein
MLILVTLIAYSFPIRASYEYQCERRMRGNRMNMQLEVLGMLRSLITTMCSYHNTASFTPTKFQDFRRTRYCTLEES